MPIIPVGTWDATVVASVLGKTGTGKEQIAITFQDEAGNRSTWYGYFTDAAIERTLETLQILGWVAAQNDWRLDTLHNTDLIVGAKAAIVVEDEEYDGKIRAKIRWVNELGGGAVKEQMAPAEAEAFAKRLRSVLARKKGPAPSTARAAAPAKPAAPASRGTSRGRGPAPSPAPGAGQADDYTKFDDDIPF